MPLLCETNRRAAQFIEQTAEKLNAEGLKVIVGNSLTDVRITDSAPYDLVFIDPPFAAELQFKALKRCAPMLASDALVYVESPQVNFPMKCLPLCHSVRSAASKPAPAICILARKNRESFMITATYPGTFDPLTNGHLDLIRRACWTFSEAHRCSCRKQKETHAFHLRRACTNGQGSRQGFSER